MTMNANLDKMTISVDQTLLMAMQKMDRHGNSTIFVTEQGRLVGCLTDGDVRRYFLGRDLDPNVSLRAVMNHDPVTCTPEDDQDKVQELMESRRLNHVPIVQRERIVGVYERSATEGRVIRDVDVEAAILCGGRGQRLGNLTQHTPKPLLSVGGMPLLLSTVKMLGRAGISKIYLLTHYRHDEFERRFGDGSDLNLEIHYLREDAPLGTAGGLAMVNGSVEGHLLVMNGDILTRLNFASLMEAHLHEETDVTVCLHPYQVSVPYGVVSFDDGGNLQRIQEKPVHHHMVLAGVYLLRKRVLKLIPRGQRFDIAQLLDKARREGYRVRIFPHHEFWLDIGHPQDFQQANIEFFVNGFDH